MNTGAGWGWNLACGRESCSAITGQVGMEMPLAGYPELCKWPKVAFLQPESSQAHKHRQFLHMEPHRLQTGWHCVHQVTLGLNKGSRSKLLTGYPTQWNPELQLLLWRASCREHSFCDAFPAELTGNESPRCPMLCHRTPVSGDLTSMFIQASAYVHLVTHLLSGQSHYRTGSW